MYSKLSFVGICGVLMISIIFIMPQSNADGKVFAQAGVAGNNQLYNSDTS